MDDEALCRASPAELQGLYARRTVSPEDVVGAFVHRIERLNPILNSFVLLAAEQALDAARAATKKIIQGGELPPLLGIPISVKDNILTAGIRSTMGSALFRNQVPDRDSGVVARLKDAGAIVLGKTNTSAFGWNATTINRLFAPSRNPYDATKTAGGSSGGAAVAAATALATINIGTDGGGSLRVPAAFTGTVGFKPTHGRVADVPPHSHWIIQHYGPVARSVSEAAFILKAIAAVDGRDPHSIPSAGPFLLPDVPKRLNVLFTTQIGWVEVVDPEIETVCRDAARAFSELGWNVSERALDWPDPSPFANVIAAAGLAHRLKGFEDRLNEIEPGIREAVARAKAFGASTFYDACVERIGWCAHSAALFDEIDLLVTPTTACNPFDVAATGPDAIAGHPVSASGWTPFLRAFNLTGQPAISVPAGRTRSGLPIGLQIVGRRHEDATVLTAAAAFERLRPWPTAWALADMQNHP